MEPSARHHDHHVKLPYYAKIGLAYHWLIDLEFRIGANALGIPTGERTIETSGMGAFDRLSTGLSVGGMAVMGAGLLLAPFTRGQSIQVAVVLAGGLTAAGAAVSLYERLQHAEVSGTGVALDIALPAQGRKAPAGVARSHERRFGRRAQVRDPARQRA